MDSTKPSSPVLQIRNLTRSYRHGSGVVHAVDDISLNLDRGEFAAIMGASGSGKSTLLHLVAGLTRVDGGTVTINGTNIHQLSDRARTLFRRRQIGLIFQAFNLIPTLTGRENMALPMLLGGERDYDERIAWLLHSLGLESVAGRRPEAMSGGEQQRVAIGRALAIKPSIVLADEPTGSLDSVNSRKLCDTFRTLCHEDGTTVLMVTHNPMVAYAAEKIFILRDGRLLAQCRREQYATAQDLAQHYLQLVEPVCEETAR